MSPSPPAAGSVTEHSLPELVHGLAAARYTGGLVLEQDGLRHGLWYVEGRIVDADSQAAGDQLGRVLLETGLVGPSPIGESLRRLAASPGRKQLDILVELGALHGDLVRQAATLGLVRRALRVFALQAATFRLLPGAHDRLEDRATPLDSRWLIWRGLRAHYDARRLERELAHVRGSAVCAATDDPEPYGFGDEERIVLVYLAKGYWELPALVDACVSLAPPTVLALVLTLLATGALDVQPAASVPRLRKRQRDETELLDRSKVADAIRAAGIPVPRANAPLAPGAPATTPGAEAGLPQERGTETPTVRTVGLEPPAGAGATPTLPDLAPAGPGATPPLPDLAPAGPGATPPLPDLAPAGPGATPPLPDLAPAGSGATPPLPDLASAGSGATPTLPDLASAGSGATPTLPDLASAGSGATPTLPDLASRRPPPGVTDTVRDVPWPPADVGLAPAPPGALPAAPPSPVTTAPGARRPSQPPAGASTAAVAPAGFVRPVVRGVESPFGDQTPPAGTLLSELRRGPSGDAPGAPGSPLAPGPTGAPAVFAAPASRPGSGASAPTGSAAARPGGAARPGSGAAAPTGGAAAPTGGAAAHPGGAASAPTGGAAAHPGGAPAVRARILAKAAQLETGVDHFTLLEVDRRATAAQVKLSYFQLAKVFHPDRLAVQNLEDLRPQVERVFSKLNDAFQTLSDEGKRKAYLALLERGGESAERKREDAEAAQAQKILGAEEAFRLGEMALRRQHYPQALEKFRHALELNPAEPEHHAMAAWATWCAAPDKASVAAAVRAGLNKAIELDAKSAIAYLYLGQVVKQLGDIDKAYGYFKKVLALQEGNVDAAREIRVIEMRRQKDRGGGSVLDRFRKK